MRSFHAKNRCNSREYEYLLPTYALQAKRFKREEAQHAGENGDNFTSTRPGLDMEKQWSYRISPDELALVRTACAEFVGTHNYHNYTIGKSFRDHSSKRYIMKFEASEYLYTVIRANEFQQ